VAVVEYDKGGAIVDIGAKALAFLPKAETSLGNDGRNIDDMIDFELEKKWSFKLSVTRIKMDNCLSQLDVFNIFR
jgi:ribosomal protein S1